MKPNEIHYIQHRWKESSYTTDRIYIITTGLLFTDTIVYWGEIRSIAIITFSYYKNHIW